MTYLDDLLDKYPEVNMQHIYSLVCCGEDMDDPLAGLCGMVAVPVFGDNTPKFEAYFGDFSEKLMQYENVPEFAINRSIGPLNALTVFDATFMNTNPLFISAGAEKWAGKILTDAVAAGVLGESNTQVLCLRKLYSAFKDELKATNSSKPCFAYAHAANLPLKFGLHKIAEKLAVTCPNLGSNVLHRARLTAMCAKKIFQSDIA